MDAVKFINELNRMCKSHDDVCTSCPLISSNCPVNDFDVEAEKVVPIVEQWSKEHPVATNEQKVRQLIPYIAIIRPLDDPGVVKMIIPRDWWDAESPEHDGCKDCKHIKKEKWEEPCLKCKMNYTDMREKRDDV